MQPTGFDEFHEVLLRLGVAMLLGGVIGVNRDLYHKPAGLRVMSLVSVGSALAAMVALTAAHQQQNVTYDGLSRVLQGILQGIGFLGAGVIMHAQGRDEVHGLTTAASIWLAGVLGLACGVGLWQLTLATFAVTVVILTVGRSIEKAILRQRPISENHPAETPPRTP